MKKFYFLALIMTLVGSMLYAQAPQGFNYQAVVRNSSGQIISNKEVSIRINILQGSETGSTVYSYSGHVTSNQNGVITIIVGENSADYAAINWANGPYFLHSEIDVNNGTDFALSTTQQILSVPYAEFASVADHVSSSFTYNEQDPQFRGWGYLYDSLINVPTKLSQFVNDLNFLTANDVQLSLSGDTLFISGGNYVVLPHLSNGATTISWDSVIGHPTNLSQFINDLSLSDFTNDLNLSDFYNDLSLSDFTNDINLTMHGDTLFFGDQFVTLNNSTTIPWDSITGRPTNLSQFINDLNLSDFNNDLTFTVSGDTLFYGTNKFVILPQNVITSIDWSNITNKPTNLSDFYNDMNFITSESQGLPDVLAINNNAGGGTITGLSTPVNDNDAANKHYADSVAAAVAAAIAATAIQSLTNQLDSLSALVDSLSTALGESMTTNDSINTTVDSLVHPSIPGLLSGKFSIGPNRKVQFSKGNLQYRPNIKLFRFAANQYEIGDNSNVGNGEMCSDWIDLFPYGTSGWAGGRTQYMPNSTGALDFQYMFPADLGDGSLSGYTANGDWGIYNPIINGGNQMATWRTLSDSEWNHLLNNRTNASSLKTLATVNGQKGLILLPDDWENTTINMSINTTVYETNNYNTTDWEVLEAAGAVFLPSAGWREGITVNGTSSVGYYWSSTRTPGQYKGSAVFINVGISTTLNSTECSHGCSVRLVRDY